MTFTSVSNRLTSSYGLSAADSKLRSIKEFWRYKLKPVFSSYYMNSVLSQLESPIIYKYLLLFLITNFVSTFSELYNLHTP